MFILLAVVSGERKVISERVINLRIEVEVFPLALVHILVEYSHRVKVIEQDSLVVVTIIEPDWSGRIEQDRVTQRFVEREVTIAIRECHVKVKPELIAQSAVGEIGACIDLIETGVLQDTFHVAEVRRYPEGCRFVTPG